MNIQQLEEISDMSEIIIYNADKLKSIFNNNDVVRFFGEHGVPRRLTLYIDFIEEKKGGLSKLGDEINKNQYYDSNNNEIHEKYKDYYAIANHNNCLIGLNEKDKKMYYIDFENSHEMYVNKDLLSFLESLYILNIRVKKIFELHPECFDYEEYFDEELIKKMVKDINEVDNNAFEEGSFWNMIVEEIIEMREEGGY